MNAESASGAYLFLILECCQLNIILFPDKPHPLFMREVSLLLAFCSSFCIFLFWKKGMLNETVLPLVLIVTLN